MDKNTLEEISLKFPFLGTLDDGEPFEYLLVSLSSNFAEIAVMNWFVNRVKLHVGDKIDLYLPNRPNAAGAIVEMNNNEELGGSVSKIALAEDPAVFNQPYNENFQNESLIESLIFLINDSMILKEGLIVYFKHLIPYFSRIGDHTDKEYAQLKEVFLHDIEKLIEINKKKLENVYKSLQQNLKKLEEIPVYVDLGMLRETFVSEISSLVFQIIFSKDAEKNIQEIFRLQDQSGPMIFINAIKSLEKRLYSNFNHIVMIYLKSVI